MASRMKEDERNEKIIRGLLKLPANRRCINCNSLGPQYVCINFWTFVCTNCSGIHREFTHRVKSVSMAKFTSQEVGALQGGGNERAKEIYFKEWDPQRHSFPDSSNVDKLRDFIKHVYVDRRFSGERTIDKTPRVKTGGMEDSYENRRADTYQGGSRSPHYEDTYEQRYSERSSPGGNYDARSYRYNYDEKRSPGYDQESRRYGEYRSPVRFEVVDDRRRDDRFGNGRRFEDRKFPDGETKEGRSPSQKASDMSSPPMVRPVRDILGENVPPLRVGEPPKSNGGKAADGPAHTQRTASSSSLGSIDGNPAELKHTTSATSGSLIDFNIDPEPPVAVAPLSQPTTPPTGQSIVQPTSSSTDENNWASFDFSTPEKVSQVPSIVNTLESVLSQLSAPAARPVDNIAVLPVTGSLPSTVLVTNMSMLPNSGSAPAAPGGHITIPTYGAPPTAPAGNKLPLPLSAGAPAPGPGGVMPTFHLWSTPSPNAPGPFGASTVHPTQAVIKPTQDNSGVALQAPPSAESKPIGRKELPADLFTATYLSVPAPVTGWQTGPPRGMGFGMQYPIASHMQTYLHSSKSTNPFDLNNEPTVVQPPMFPSMVSLQGALPNIAAPAGLLRTSSLGNPSPQWVPSPPPSYGSAMPQSPTYASTMPSSPYMGQQVYSPFGHQGVGSSNGASFGNLSTDQQLAGRYSQSSTPNSFSSPGGNPFG